MLKSLIAPKQETSLIKTLNLLVISTATLSYTLIGCANVNNSSTKNGAFNTEKIANQKPAIVEFADIPMPKKREINLEKTMVVGTEVWFGRLTYDTGQSAENMFAFYAKELGGYGWKKITAVRAKTSLMTYQHENRVITIAITPNRIHGSEVRITMSPKQQSSSTSKSPPPMNEKPILYSPRAR